MKEIFADKEKSKEWIKENYKFLAKEFGKENIVRFTLHLDENPAFTRCNDSLTMTDVCRPKKLLATNNR